MIEETKDLLLNSLKSVEDKINFRFIVEICYSNDEDLIERNWQEIHLTNLSYRYDLFAVEFSNWKYWIKSSYVYTEMNTSYRTVLDVAYTYSKDHWGFFGFRLQYKSFKP